MDGRSVGTSPSPAAGRTAVAALARSAVATVGMTVRRRIHQPRSTVGHVLHFADGTSAPVYRVTAAEVAAVNDPCVLVVGFRLRGVRGLGHAAFRAESILNTPLFAGFPGFVSKLWLAHDQDQRYRGVYDWDGPERAESYVRALYRVLAVVSEPGSVQYRILPGLRRAELLADPAHATPDGVAGALDWWRVVRSVPPAPIGRVIPPQRLITALNPVVRAALRSPLHPALDGGLLLLHLTGRRTGKRYAIPVDFTDLGDGRLLVLTQHRWRANLRGGAEVQITHRGRRTPTHAELVEEPAAVAQALRAALAGRSSREIRGRLGLRVPAGHTPDVAELEAAARAFDLAVILLADPARPAPRAGAVTDVG